MERRIADMAKLAVVSYTFSANFFGGKCKLIGGFWELWELAFRMYVSPMSQKIRTTYLGFSPMSLR